MSRSGAAWLRVRSIPSRAGERLLDGADLIENDWRRKRRRCDQRTVGLRYERQSDRRVEWNTLGRNRFVLHRLILVLAIGVVVSVFAVPAAAQDPVIAAAGDIACDPGGSTNPCRQMETSDLLVGAGLTRVLPLGDVTQSGSASLANILALYDPSW